MNGFIDIHTHVLPGVDDGAADMQEALALVRMAWQNGTRTLITTPHYRKHYQHGSVDDVQETFDQLCQLVSEEFPEFKLCLGTEMYYEIDGAEKLISRDVLTLHNSRYMLLEFWQNTPRSQVIAGISELIRCGYVPVIAHVERYPVFRKDPHLIDEVLNMGVLLQINTESVLGKAGFSAKRFCHKLLKNQKVHFIASDAHNTTERPPCLRTCFLYVHKKYGQAYAMQLFYENAQAVIENRTL